MENNQYDLRDYRIPLESRHERGWGKVTIAADANPADNDFYFAFERPAVRRAVIVADDGAVAAPLQLAAAISPDSTVPSTAEVLTPDRLATLEWEKISLLIWQSPLPEGDLAQRVREFVDRGGYAIFLPLRCPGRMNSSVSAGPRGPRTRARIHTEASRWPRAGAATRTCFADPKRCNAAGGPGADSPLVRFERPIHAARHAARRRTPFGAVRRQGGGRLFPRHDTRRR